MLVCACAHPCTLNYPACQAGESYYLRPLWLHHIFLQYLANSTILGKKVTEHKMCVLIFSTIFIWNVSNSKKNSTRYCHKCEDVFMWSTSYFLLDFNWTWNILKFFKKMLKYQISWKCVQWQSSWFHADGKSDMTKLTVAFRNVANAPNKRIINK